MKKTTFCLLSVLLFGGSNAVAQTDTVKYESMIDFFREGKVSGNLRAFFMSTDNQSNLSDYYALAIGSGITYHTPKVKGFSAGISGYVVSNVLSSNFTVLDNITQKTSRYEIGLYDIINSVNKYELTRLEELWVGFEGKKMNVKVGRYVPQNLFINSQDGRMRPTMVQGVEVLSNIKKNKLNVQFIRRISPRSTFSWYHVEKSFGIYSTGRNPDGTPSNYFQNVNTPGIFIAEVTNTSIHNTSLLLGSLTVPNVFQTYYLNPEFSGCQYFGGLMVVGQHQLKNGGNIERANTYANEQDKSLIVSGRIGRKMRKSSVDVNFTSIRSSGRFLMPREWGREPFYTYLSRERNEGAGNVNAFSTNVEWNLNSALNIRASYGKFFLPSASDAAQNKYALPSYNQLNLLLNHDFENVLKGLTVKGLFVRKSLMNKSEQSPRYIFNKVNLSHYNLIFEFSF